VQSAVAIQADLALAADALTAELQSRRFTFSKTSPWWKLLSEKQEKNKQTVAVSKVISVFLKEFLFLSNKVL